MIFFWLLSKLPLWILYRFSDFIYLLIRYIIKYRIEIIRSNITNSFPTSSPQAVSTLINRFYRNFSDQITETIKMYSISASELDRRVIVKNKELILQYLDHGQSTLVVAPHMFNWEWMVTVARLKTPYPYHPAYRPLKNKFFDQLLIRMRSRFGGKPTVGKELVEMMKTEPSPIGYSLMIDFVAAKPELWMNFLNQETVFDLSIEKLAAETGFPVIYPKMTKPKRGHYVLELIEISKPGYDGSWPLMKKFVGEIEKTINEQPETFLWSHRRWKYKKPLPVI
ncbi:MAG: lysophospholipid acyltransferase family protein [Cyclobacteriaceae bacterium]